MKLKIILPVAETERTRTNNKYVREALKCLNPNTEVSISFLPCGAEALNSITNIEINTMMICREAIKAEQEGADGVLICCMADPAVEMIREQVHIPVIGAFRSSMLMAVGCGKRVAILLPGEQDYASKLLVRKNLENNPEFNTSVVYMDFCNLDVLDLCDEDVLLSRLVDFSEQAYEQDCDSVLLCCTNMSYIVNKANDAIRNKGMQINIIDPIACGIKYLEAFVELHLSNSLQAKVGADAVDANC